MLTKLLTATMLLLVMGAGAWDIGGRVTRTDGFVSPMVLAPGHPIENALCVGGSLDFCPNWATTGVAVFMPSNTYRFHSLFSVTTRGVPSVLPVAKMTFATDLDSVVQLDHPKCKLSPVANGFYEYTCSLRTLFQTAEFMGDFRVSVSFDEMPHNISHVDCEFAVRGSV